MKIDNKNLKKSIIVIPVSFILLLTFFLILIKHSLQVEKYCQAEANMLIPIRKVKMVKPTYEEEKEIWGISSIDTQFREVLNCERENTYFGF